MHSTRNSAALTPFMHFTTQVSARQALEQGRETYNSMASLVIPALRELYLGFLNMARIYNKLVIQCNAGFAILLAP